MRFLLVVPAVGFKADGTINPGGLAALGRCVAKALASSPKIEKLGLWSQLDPPETGRTIRRMLAGYARPALELDVRPFGRNRLELSAAVLANCLTHDYDTVMYLLVNQAILSIWPGHPPYVVWEIGRELFAAVSWPKLRALQGASRLLSISRHTAQAAATHNSALPEACVVHPCAEPPLFAPEPDVDPAAAESFAPAAREPSVLIVATMYRDMAHKGHRELIAAWPQVVQACPQAELWIVGDGDGRAELEAQAQTLPAPAGGRICFLGQLDNQALQERYRRCRVFAMPSAGEGFGLVFVEAARFGVPCIAGRHDAAQEIVLDGSTGLLVEQDPHEVAQACIKLLTDGDLACRLGEAGRRRYLEQFRFQHFRQRLLSSLQLD